MSNLIRVMPNDMRHGKKFFFYDEQGFLYYGPHEDDLHFPSNEEMSGRFPITIKDLENAFKAGKGLYTE